MVFKKYYVYILAEKLLPYLKTVQKQHRPSKICLACKRPFTWRKKWTKVWNDVKYCSEKCSRNKLKT
ncbi:MAG: DUF2256 domain-containing protein [Ferruginibacter sp.]